MKYPPRRATFGSEPTVMMPFRAHELHPRPSGWFLPFLGAWALAAFALVALAYALGFAPPALSELGDAVTSFFIDDAGVRNAASNTDGATAALLVESRGPRLMIPEIQLDARIVEPMSTNLTVLNEALLSGVVHYPGSARPNEVGNVLLFGHSTGLKVVHNKNFEVFNRLKELKPGDMIRIRYGDREYWYQVASLRQEKASEATIDLRPGERMLTLVTCNVFGAKEDRYIVEAHFVKSYPLRSAR